MAFVGALGGSVFMLERCVRNELKLNPDSEAEGS